MAGGTISKFHPGEPYDFVSNPIFTYSFIQLRVKCKEITGLNASCRTIMNFDVKPSSRETFGAIRPVSASGCDFDDNIKKEIQ